MGLSAPFRTLSSISGARDPAPSPPARPSARGRAAAAAAPPGLEKGAMLGEFAKSFYCSPGCFTKRESVSLKPSFSPQE